MREVKDLVPSVSIDNLLAQRDAIVERLRGIARLHDEIEELSKSAFKSTDAVPSLRCYYTNSTVPDMMAMVKRADAAAWDYLLNESGLRTFMDAAAREKWGKSIYERTVPALTLENIRETFSMLYDTRGKMFEDGVLAVFRRLSWCYKTNNPYLFGKRIIMEYVLDIWSASGGKKYSSGISHTGSNKLDDLLRVMMVLDGQPELDHRNGAYHVLRKHFNTDVHTKEPVELHGMLTIKCFKNGNGHITFLRPDLVDKLNEIVRKHHPNALPAKR